MVRISKYKELSELTVEIVNEVIDKIVNLKPTDTKHNCTIQINIYYNFIGKLDNKNRVWDKRILILGIPYYKFLKSID